MALAALIFLACIFSPPNLMDDVDAVQPQIARNMLQSGDWVTPRLDGIAYLEKPPLKYWMMAVSFLIFGVHDWAARLPIALAAVLLCWIVARFGAWAFDSAAGLYAGLSLATCVGLFLFTRVLISDVILTLAITLSLWSLARALDDEEAHPALWAMLLWAAMAVGLLLKGLIAVVLPVGSGLLYLAPAAGGGHSRLGGGCAYCRGCFCCWPSRPPGTCWLSCAIRLTWISPCTPSLASIAGSSGSISSTSMCCGI